MIESDSEDLPCCTIGAKKQHEPLRLPKPQHHDGTMSLVIQDITTCSRNKVSKLLIVMLRMSRLIIV